MTKRKETNQHKYVPIWVPEYVFISLMREADERNEEVSQLFLLAWTNFLSNGLKDTLKEDIRKSKWSLSRKGKNT